MQIKYKKALCNYKYLVMFDLASHLTGVCLWDIEQDIPIQTDVIKIANSCEDKTLRLYNEFQNYFKKLIENGINLNDVLVYKEAMPTQVHGGASTIQTFLALAKAHAILDLFLLQNGIDIYDDIGVYPASTHAYYRHLCNTDIKCKVDKRLIQDYIYKKYSLLNLSFDESDAVFLALTFIHIKWNKDLDEKIREVKRHKKELKVSHAIIDCDNRIAFLNSLKF